MVAVVVVMAGGLGVGMLDSAVPGKAVGAA